MAKDVLVDSGVAKTPGIPSPNSIKVATTSTGGKRYSKGQLIGLKKKEKAKDFLKK